MRALLLAVLLLTGCASIPSMILGDKSISAKERIEYANALGEMKERYEAFSVYHYAAAAIVVLGIAAILLLRRTRDGFIAIASGAGLSAWAAFAPSHPKLIAIIIVSCILVVVSAVGIRLARIRKHANCRLEVPDAK